MSFPMKLDHIAIVVKDMEQAVSTYTQKLGLSLKTRKIINSEGIEIAVMQLDNTEIELIMPINNNTGTARFLEKRGEGLHHICMEIEDMEVLLKSLEALGIKLVNKIPFTGYKGNKAIFVHPSSTNGVLIEFNERG